MKMKRYDLRTIKPEARAEVLRLEDEAVELWEGYQHSTGTAKVTFWYAWSRKDMELYDFVQDNLIKGQRRSDDAFMPEVREGN